MTVYVDDMRARYDSMVMCHMTADTDAELHDMADTIRARNRDLTEAGVLPRRANRARRK